MHGSSAGTFLAQITVLLLVGRLLGELMQRVRQPAVMGQLLAGVILGPSVLGALLPSLQHRLFPPMAAQQGMLEGVAQLGVLMLLLITGMEMDFARVARARRPALFASSCGIIVPFALGFALGEVVPRWLIPSEGRRTITALFLGTALAISSVKIVASVIRDLDFMRRNVGQIIVAAAIVDDTVGWIILSMIVGFARTGAIDPLAVAKTALSTAVFLAVALTVGRRVVYLLIRWTNDHLLSEMPVITTTLVVMGALGLLTQGLGVQTVLGAFVAGLLIGQSPILTRHIEEQLRGMIVALFMPVFFGLAGLSADLKLISTPMMVVITLAFIVVASVGKFAGAFAGGALGGLTRAESLALACGMNARGSTEVIVATIGLSVGALDTMLFTMIVTMAVATTLLMPPMLRWAFARIPYGEDEREQLERAEFEERAFVARLERVLLTTDDSPSGRLASYLVGLITAPRGIPVTALAPDTAPEDVGADRRLEEVRDAMTQAAVRTQVEAVAGDDPPQIDLIATRSGEPAEHAVAREGRKGYDLLVVGMEPLLCRAAEVSPTIARVVRGFERAICIVSARGRDAQSPASAGRRILLPVIGAAYARDAADLALALARTSGARITALYVATVSERATWRRRLSRSWSLADAAESVLQDVLELSRHYSVAVHTAIESSRAVPEDAILRELRAGRHDLLVMGLVGARPGDPVFRGSTPAALLERAPCSMLLLAS